MATWYKQPTLWKRPLCWERLRAEGEGGNRGWDGWMASPTQWTWVWANSGRWWRTGEPGVLQSMGSWVKHNLVKIATILLQKVVCFPPTCMLILIILFTYFFTKEGKLTKVIPFKGVFFKVSFGSSIVTWFCVCLGLFNGFVC